MCNPVSTRHPELLISKGVHEGFEWEVTSNRMAYRCGYVRIPAGHPWYGKDYESAEPYPDVHGGLTFSEPDTDCGKGGEDNAWWLGFDCAHAGDAPDPALPGFSARLVIASGDQIRTTGYVEDQCRSLAAQAAAVQRADGRTEEVELSAVEAADLVEEWIDRLDRFCAALERQGFRVERDGLDVRISPPVVAISPPADVEPLFDVPEHDDRTEAEREGWQGSSL